MFTGVQFTGSLAPNASHRWSTNNWNPAWHVIWTMMPSTPASVPELDWSVAVERVSATAVTYWITVNNRSGATVTFDARYAVMT